jgi:MFS family permease
MHQTRIINPARWHVLAVVVAAQFVFVVDAFIVNVAIPSIRRDLGATSGEMQAVIAVYQIAYATMVISLFMQGQLGFSPLQGGLAVVPLAVAFTVASRLAGPWVSRYGVRTLLSGCVIQFAGVTALAGVAAFLVDPAIALIMAVLTVFGFGQGLVMAPLSGLTLATVRPAHAGSAAGVLNTVHQTAGATGVSLVGVLGFSGDTLGALALLGASCIATAALLLAMRK